MDNVPTLSPLCALDDDDDDDNNQANCRLSQLVKSAKCPPSVAMINCVSAAMVNWKIEMNEYGISNEIYS